MMPPQKNTPPSRSGKDHSPRKSHTAEGSVNGEGTSSDEEQTNPEEQRRRARVVLRTGSPKASARISLRVTNSKLPQSSITTPKSNQSPVSSIKTAGSTQPSLKIKSPPKSAWAPPTVRSPAYHEKKTTLKRKTIFDIAQPVPTPSFRKKDTLSQAPPASAPPAVQRLPQPPRSLRYSVDSLLALRPCSADIRIGRSVYSENDGYGRPLRELQIPNAGLHGRYFPPIPLDDKFFAYGEDFSTTANRPLNVPWMQLPLSSIYHNNIYEGSGSHSLEQSRNFEILNKSPSPSKEHSEEQAASVEDLESRIRSALSQRGRRRHIVDSGKPRSVRWDPAIVGRGPGVLEPPMTSESTDEPGSFSENSHEFAPEQQPRKISQSSETEKGRQKEQKKKFYGYMRSITELKKGDRKKLLQLLEALKNLDSDESSDSDNEMESPRRKSRTSRIQIEKRLNPMAVSFENSKTGYENASSLRELKFGFNEQHQPSLSAPPTHDSRTVEPIWIKNSDFVKPQKVKSERTQESQSRPTSSSRHVLPVPQVIKTFRDSSHTEAPLFPPGLHTTSASNSLMPLPVPNAHCLPPMHQTPHQYPRTTKVNASLPIIDLATGRIPSEDDHGREAHVVPWGGLILQRFCARYPRTGLDRADPPAPVRNTHAATIQQRLEYLLMQQKERKARGQSLSERAGNQNAQGVDGGKSLYEIEKQTLKRLKSEIRRDEMVRKNNELLLTPAAVKIRVRTINLAGERISETSTCVESEKSHGTNSTDVEEDRMV